MWLQPYADHPLLCSTFSPTLPSDRFAIDCPRRAINPSECLPIFPTSLPRGVAKAALDCAHRTIYMLPPSSLVFFHRRVACLASHCACPTRVFSDRALHEHRRPTDPLPLFSFPPPLPPRGVARLSFTARVQRGPSEAARCASKKDGLMTPLPFLPLTDPLPPVYDSRHLIRP